MSADNHGLTPAQLDRIKKILAPFAERIDQVVLFGSRASGTFRPSSDIDLALYGPIEEKDVDRLHTLFMESDLPVRVDVVKYQAINSVVLKQHIDQAGVNLFEKRELLSTADEARPSLREKNDSGHEASFNIHSYTAMIPEWTEKKLKDVVKINPTEKLQKGTVAKKIAMEHLRPFTRDIQHYDIAAYNGGSKFRNGDTIVARITPCLENGKTAQVNCLEANEIGFGSTEFIVMRHIDGLSSSGYIYYLATNPDFRQIAIKSMIGSSGRQRVQQDVVENYVVKLPPLAEQRAIAATLSCLDDKIELNNKINANLEAQAQAIFKSWFVDFEPFGGKMPDDWQEAPLGSLVQIIDNRGKTPPLAPQPTEYPIIDVKALSGNQRIVNFNNCTKFVEAETYNLGFRSGHPKPYDILLSTVGSLAEMKLFFGERGCIAQNVVAFRSGMPLYLYQYLQYIKDDLISYNIGSVQPSIKVTHLIKHPIIKPTDNALSQFNEIVHPMSKEIFTNHCQSEQLATLRDTLLPRLMSGELPVTDFVGK